MKRFFDTHFVLAVIWHRQNPSLHLNQARTIYFTDHFVLEPIFS